jgi:hypothetical protein
MRRGSYVVGRAWVGHRTPESGCGRSFHHLFLMLAPWEAFGHPLRSEIEGATTAETSALGALR